MKNLFPLFIILFLSACSSTPVLPPADDINAAWLVHRGQLAKLDTWKMTGRIAVSSETDSWHATLQWIEQPKQYTINIIAPMGQGGAHIKGNNKHVTLRSDEGKIFEANTAEELLTRHTGMRVPLEGMRFWARGLPEPDRPGIEKLNESGHLAELNQSDWLIEFMRYHRVKGHVLPGKVFMNTADLKVKIVIDKWEFY
ncbi:MAG: lipoprotein insertase outer membrane protein LolB [Gammaproteobacteria bacterium]|nr:lipoprotein insertase outer membrane protein LolB [Gammaproteobacteria bacterium]MDH5594089.1 lipoprotein insertase outer membrane protein LolB [Gammaproteobacteria bacterium]MDH5613817.1 lipoprotein insertase outer membrane protein LolB [Gammaproteobacteria bacterium]